MQSFLLFSVKSLNYAISLDKLEHIMVVPTLTENSKVNSISEGMITYNSDVIDVYSFRRMIGVSSKYDDTIIMFEELKQQHKAWVDSLDDSVNKGYVFTKTTNPHMCHLGKWIDTFSSENREVNQVLKGLKSHHNSLHKSAIDVLEYTKVDKTKAINWIESHVKEIYSETIKHLNQIAKHSKQVANDSQKLLILSELDFRYALKVDAVDNIIHIDENKIIQNDTLSSNDRYLNISGVLKYEDSLVSIIETFKVKGQ